MEDSGLVCRVSYLGIVTILGHRFFKFTNDRHLILLVKAVANLPSLSVVTTTIKTRSRTRSVRSNKTITIETENKINGMKIEFGTTLKE